MAVMASWLRPGESGLKSTEILIVSGADKAEKRFNLKVGKSIRIGRSDENDLVIKLEGVSVDHAEILAKTDGSGFCVRDHSKNGTGLREGSSPDDPEKPWSRLQNGGTRTVGHGWQLLIPIKGKKGDTGATLSEQSRTLTIQIPELALEAKNGCSKTSSVLESKGAAPLVTTEKKAPATKELPQQSVVFSSPSPAESDDEVIELVDPAKLKSADSEPQVSNGRSNLKGSVDPQTGFGRALGRGSGRGSIRGRGARRGGGHLPSALRGGSNMNKVLDKTPGSPTSTSLSSAEGQSDGGSSASSDYPVRKPTTEDDLGAKKPHGYARQHTPPHSHAASGGGRYEGREGKGMHRRDLNSNLARSRRDKNSSGSDTGFTRARKVRKAEQSGNGFPRQDDQGGYHKRPAQSKHRSDWSE